MSEFHDNQRVKLKDEHILNIGDEMRQDLSYLHGVIGILHWSSDGLCDWYFDTEYGTFPVLDSEIEAVQP
jgi:hypothetical protein